MTDVLFKWIPVSDGLPDDDQTVLVCKAGFDDSIVFAFRDSNIHETAWLYENTENPINYEITHWANLPTVPDN